MHVSENLLTKHEPKNYYAYLSKQRNSPDAQVGYHADKPQKRRLTEQEQEFMEQMKGMTAPEIFAGL
jgi:hypothetical protein